MFRKNGMSRAQGRAGVTMFRRACPMSAANALGTNGLDTRGHTLHSWDWRCAGATRWH
jgi:hypothetical protein